MGDNYHPPDSSTIANHGSAWSMTTLRLHHSQCSFQLPHFTCSCRLPQGLGDPCDLPQMIDPCRLTQPPFAVGCGPWAMAYAHAEKLPKAVFLVRKNTRAKILPHRERTNPHDPRCLRTKARRLTARRIRCRSIGPSVNTARSPTVESGLGNIADTRHNCIFRERCCNKQEKPSNSRGRTMNLAAWKKSPQPWNQTHKIVEQQTAKGCCAA